MIVMQAFHAVSNHLIEIMGTLLCVALVFRYIAYRASMANEIYYKAFSRSVEKIVENQDKSEKIEDVERWIHGLLDNVTHHLPSRSLRSNQEQAERETTQKTKHFDANFRHQKREEFTEFADGKKSIIHSVKQQLDAFKSPHPPNFAELTQRVLNQDRKWSTILGIIPIKTLSGILDILPGLFIVGGIFGTFIGITGALPKIATIDLSKLDEAAPILNAFVASVAYSMNTSIAGIVYNVTLTILNTVFPLNHSRVNVQKSLERSFELMWYRIHGTQISSGESQVIALLSEIRNSLAGERKPNGKGLDSNKLAA